MREIKFRGKAVWSLDKLNESNIDHVNGWVYGNLVMYDDIPFIVALSLEDDAYDFWVKVHPESVGQYTGWKDENGREIYEGDIVRCYGGAYLNGTYEYDYVTEVRDIRDLNGIVHSENVEILGNKYENQELLEGEE